MGGSIGGALAIDFAVEHPDAVSKLVLVDPQVLFHLQHASATHSDSTEALYCGCGGAAVDAQASGLSRIGLTLSRLSPSFLARYHYGPRQTRSL